jgi:heme-degrading monooxygenase HmoA
MAANADYPSGTELEEVRMIARHWRGWTTTDQADAYETLLRTTIFPKIQRITGAHGGYVLRRDTDDGVEFVTVTLFDSMAAIHQFAGADADIAVVPPEARQLLTRFDDRAVHYDIVVAPA